MGKYTFDEQDSAILAERQARRDALSARTTWPLVGDLIDMGDGTFCRVTYVWDCGQDSADYGVQLGKGGTFYLCEGGGMSYSGSLDPSIPARRFVPAGTGLAAAWFFHHDWIGAHCGVDFLMTVRRWTLQGEDA